MASQQHAPRSWMQLRFVCDAGTAGTLADCLSACGALSVSLDDAEDQPLYEPPPGATPLWSSTRVSALFTREEATPTLIAELRRRLAPVRLPQPEMEVLEEQEWIRNFEASVEPRCFGARLWVTPSWAKPPALAAGQAGLTLDPGLAFGTGSHPTTRMCLDWLAARELSELQVVDYGCGSGILAVAAAKLGARRVWAVDNDPQALVATSRNAADNDVAARVRVCAPGGLPPLAADLLVANILANTLSELAPALTTLLAGGGALALAGILDDQAQRVSRSYAPRCRLQPTATLEGWTLLAGRRVTGGG